MGSKPDLFGPRPLTPPISLTGGDPRFEDLRQHTYPGMASWGKSGPAGTHCRECKFWAFAGYFIGRETLKPGKCGKYRQLSYQEGQAVPAHALSCQYFEANPDAPPMYLRDARLKSQTGR